MQLLKKNILIFLSLLILIGTMFFILEKTRYLFVVDSDILWHIKTGEWILSNKKVPKVDVFSWHEGLNWMPHEWLYDVFLSILYKKLRFTIGNDISIIFTIIKNRICNSI